MSKTSVSRLFGLGLTPGKLRGLQRICNDNGTLTMVATDQNSSMIKMLKKHLNREPTYDEIVEAKNDLTEALSPVASAILVDGYYGIWNAVAGLRVPKDTGLLVRVEHRVDRRIVTMLRWVPWSLAGVSIKSSDSAVML